MLPTDITLNELLVWSNELLLRCDWTVFVNWRGLRVIDAFGTHFMLTKDRLMDSRFYLFALRMSSYCYYKQLKLSTNSRWESIFQLHTFFSGRVSLFFYFFEISLLRQIFEAAACLRDSRKRVSYWCVRWWSNARLVNLRSFDFKWHNDHKIKKLIQSSFNEGSSKKI